MTDLLAVSTDVLGGGQPVGPAPTAQRSASRGSLAGNVDAIDELYADCTATADGAIVEDSLLGKLSAAMRAEDGWTRLCYSYGGEGSLLARFATAAERDFEASLSRLRATLEFRERERVHAIVGRALPEALLADGPPDPRLEVIRTVRPFWTGTFCGRTRDGSPIQYHRAVYMDNEHLMAFDDASLRAFYLWWMETGLSLQRAGQQQCGQASQGLMPKSIEVYDLRGLSSFRLARWALGLRKFAKIISEIGTVRPPPTPLPLSHAQSASAHSR